MVQEETREKIVEERGGKEEKKGYTYQFYHDIGKRGGQATSRTHDREFYSEIGHKGGIKGGEATKRKHGHETLREHMGEHQE